MTIALISGLDCHVSEAILVFWESRGRANQDTSRCARLHYSCLVWRQSELSFEDSTRQFGLQLSRLNLLHVDRVQARKRERRTPRDLPHVTVFFVCLCLAFSDCGLE